MKWSIITSPLQRLPLGIPISPPRSLFLCPQPPHNTKRPLWRREPSSCKHKTKSKSHPSMKLAPVRVFSCKHPLSSQCFVSQPQGLLTLALGLFPEAPLLRGGGGGDERTKKKKRTNGEASSLFFFPSFFCVYRYFLFCFPKGLNVFI